MSNDMKLLRTVKKLGSSIGGQELGGRSFEWLELALASKIFPKKFTNVPTLRTRAHVLLYWRKGFLKTTLLREFAKIIPNKFKTVHLTSATIEVLCGSIFIPKMPFQRARIVPPVLAGADFASIYEHSTLLRARPMAAKLSLLNDILEGDNISTSLVKLGQVQIDPSQKPELEKLGIRFYPDESRLIYEPDVVILSASHPFDRKTLSILIDAGHFDRFHVVQAQITPEIARKCFREDYSLDKDLQEQLKRQNEKLCAVRIKSIDAPPHHLLKPVYEKLFTLTEIPDFRIKGGLLRATAAHMVLRHFDQGNTKDAYTEQDYTADDISFVSERVNDFVEPRINPLVTEGHFRKPRKRDYVKKHICDYLKASKLAGKTSEPLLVIYMYVHSRMPGVHYQTTVNGVKELLREGKVERVPGVHGHYRLVEKKKGS